ncbi:MAG TPA: kelch repeat-containing protein [Steroidobacteraceae bacterium]|jgi:N-acetylneuraminic acid mutarotase
MTKSQRILGIAVAGAVIAVSTACGGGGGGSSVTTYQVSSTAGTGGSIAPASTTVNAGSTTTLTVTPKAGYVVSGVTGCGGSLTAATYTTAAVAANCTVTASFAAAFTWVGGSNSADATGSYGTLGVAAATNVPGARDDGATWTDASGNLWLFGGFAGFVHNPTNGDFLNDLWKYSPSSGQWTWVSGSNTVAAQGVYGSKGVAAATNVPGARSNDISWIDGSGNFWLFGGGGTDATGAFVVFNDLWMYSPSSGQWTWEGGSSTVNASGVYGTQGVAAAANVPGARLVSNTVVTDPSGNVWLFGGHGYDAGGNGGDLNDLWEYSPSSGQWTWVSGSNTVNARGVYGAQGVAATSNVPGARYIPVIYFDASGNLWLFGGDGLDSVGTTGELNDLWEFSPASAEWTWVGGFAIANTAGIYGTQGVAAATNVPAGRNQAVGWTDAGGNLWLFGGEGFNTSTGFFHRLNDLWKYSPTGGEATWVAGSSGVDAVGVYGTEGVAAAANLPGARAGTSKWKDGSGNVWLFGGYQYDDSTNTRFEYNDLWTYPTQ